MTIDQARLRQLAPFALPLVILLGGWFLLVRPASADATKASRELQSLRPRLDSIRRTLNEPPPPAITIQPEKSFLRQVVGGDPSARLFDQLTRLAPPARFRNLMIANGEQVSAAPAGPQVAGAEAADPRFTLFPTPLTYLPITMSFDASYTAVGDFLWQLRDLGTIVEIRSIDIARTSRPADTAASTDVAARTPNDDVHVSLKLFAYARVPERTAAVAATSGAARR